MRFNKAFGLAIIVATAAMAFLGSSTVSAQIHEVVLCKELVTLCPNGALWPSLSTALFLVESPELKSSLGTIKCEDSIMTAELASEIGNPLSSKNTIMQFGVLPTPKLGANCTGPCMKEAQENIHTALEKLEYIVEPGDVYTLRLTGLLLLLNCPIVGTCTYRWVDHVLPIKHDGRHELHKGAENLPLVEFVEILTRQTTHGGSIFCPSTTLWEGNYVLYLILSPDGSTSGLGWPALDVKA